MCKREDSRLVIGVSQCSEDEWRHKVNQEITREALFYDDVKVEIRTSKDDTEKQRADIRYFIDHKVDLIMVAPNEEEPLTGIIAEAYEMGIKIIVFDRKILSDKYTAFVGADNYEIGRSVGRYVTKLLHGKGNVMEITGLMGSTPALERHQGFINTIDLYPDIKLLSQVDAQWLQGPGEILTDSLLKIYPDVDLVYSHNDRMALGAYEAAVKQGREQNISFIGIDALPGEGYGLDLVSKRVLDATFIYPTAGDKMLQLAMDILKGRPFPRETILNTAVVDSTNAHVMLLQTNEISLLDNKIETLNGRMAIFLSRYASQQSILLSSLIVLCLVAVLLVVVFSALRSKNKLNKELSAGKEQLEAQRDQLIDLSRQLEEATQAKLVFFTNISHDFRTPLTLVADPLEKLLQEDSSPDESRKLLALAKKNVNILLRLVDQILDFRKYENGKMEFAPTHINPVRLIREWNESFMESVRKKFIRFSFAVDPGMNQTILADAEKLERVYFNLMSNAIKFTPQNGRISVHLGSYAKDDDTLFFRLMVANTGSLIEPEHIRNIFDRFYKVDMRHAGSGIGLALVKAFVELHNGEITVESDKKRGTIFIVNIPMNSYTEESLPVNPSFLPSSDISELKDVDIDDTPELYDPVKSMVLIIDDNADIRAYIRSILQAEYTVFEASNGIEGIRKAVKYVPDVIVSDVMMPGMDGIECCSRLKKELRTCHIPVMLLTACSLDEQRVKGYNVGADSYISKPFSSQVLQSRLRNLIEASRRMKPALGEGQLIIREDACDLDRDFVGKFHSLIEKSMSDSDLNIEELGRAMGLSRVQLYRKVKSLTNFAPNELLRILRLRKAASLLASVDMTVAEVCYKVGFTSPSYFSKCYKEQYGESPTDFLRRNK